MKQDATAFYDLMFNDCRPGEAIDHYEPEMSEEARRE
jgi:hypothetical protein